MIKRIDISDLKSGMYLEGLERASLKPGKFPEQFLNTLLIRAGSEVDKFVADGYTHALVFVADEIEFAPISVVPNEEVVVDASLAQEHIALAETEDTRESPKLDAAQAQESATIVEFLSPREPEEETVNEATRHFGDIDESGEPEFDDSVNVTDRKSFAEEIENAKSIRSEANGVVESFMSDARAGKDIETDGPRRVVSSMIDSIFNNQDALVSLSRLKEHDDYTFAHSINVCVLSLTLGRRLGFSKEEMGLIGTGALLHDVGKMMVPEEILNKPGVLTEPEYLEMKKHVAYGRQILMCAVDIDEKAINIATEHHEKLDGSGYPKGLAGKQIHPFARIVCIADFYDAMTSGRVYKEKLLPSDVIKRVYSWSGIHFDSHMVDRFIRCLGIYPVGSLVRLDNGETAAVSSVNRGNFLEPEVKVLFDSLGNKHSDPYELDLSIADKRSISESADPLSLGLVD